MSALSNFKKMSNFRESKIDKQIFQKLCSQIKTNFIPRNTSSIVYILRWGDLNENVYANVGQGPPSKFSS